MQSTGDLSSFNERKAFFLTYADVVDRCIIRDRIYLQQKGTWCRNDRQV